MGPSQSIPKANEPSSKSFYEGETNDLGVAHGQGKRSFEDGSVFKGEFRDGAPSHGVFTYQNGFTYDGELVAGVPDGRGTWTDNIGKYDGTFYKKEFVEGTVNYKNNAIYVGSMKNGRKHSGGRKNTFIYPNGDTFQGQFDNDEFKIGTFTSKEKGYVYEGSFNNGVKDGYGQLKNGNEYQYAGNFMADKFHGFGTLKYLQVKKAYEGGFKEGMMHGEGTLVDGDSIYVGSFVDNKKNGQGQYRFNGRKYVGGFLDNKFHGKGKLTYSNGNTYEGLFDHNKKKGYGRLQLRSQNTSYEGEFDNDLIQGKGIYHYKNGDIYEGSFQAGKKHGQGVYKTSEGVIYKGEWVKDIRHGIFSEANAGQQKVGNYVNGERDGEFKITLIPGKERVQIWKMGVLMNL